MTCPTDEQRLRDCTVHAIYLGVLKKEGWEEGW
jgi:hypothetical protein